jgi:hypothetical protein
MLLIKDDNDNRFINQWWISTWLILLSSVINRGLGNPVVCLWGVHTTHGHALVWKQHWHIICSNPDQYIPFVISCSIMLFVLSLAMCHLSWLWYTWQQRKYVDRWKIWPNWSRANTLMTSPIEYRLHHVYLDLMFSFPQNGLQLYLCAAKPTTSLLHSSILYFLIFYLNFIYFQRITHALTALTCSPLI